MIRIIDKRASGKTGRLMLLAKENNAYFVTRNAADAKSKAYDYGIVGIDFISYYDYLNKRYDVKRPIVIDEIDGLLSSISSGSNVIAYSISED